MFVGFFFPVTIFAFDIPSTVYCFSCTLTTLNRAREQDKADIAIEYAKRKRCCYVGLILNCFQVISYKILTDKKSDLHSVETCAFFQKLFGVISFTF